jgi:hypothetical protein
MSWKLAAVVLGLLAIVLALWVLRPQMDFSNTVVEQFWRPVLDAKDPLLIALPHPAVYRPTLHAVERSEERAPTGATQSQQILQVPFERLTGTDFQLVTNQYVGFGDAVVASAVSGFLGTHSRPTRLRLADRVEFADMRETPVLLIGAFTNRWTMELTQGFRFRPEWEHQENAHISETAAPYRTWRVTGRTQDEWATEDYILLCRLPHSTTGGALFVAAGITQSGTEAAATVLFSAGHLEPILAKLPRDWASHNLELLLHTRVIGRSANPPEVVAWHIW